MQCFVIMPFAPSFEDVYTAISQSVDRRGMQCTRLDQFRPAGRITHRLIGALRDCSFCIADLTGCNPNVMWETGYAMALGKPLILITQDLGTLPFDVRDMQALAYDRAHLSRTLINPLRSVIADTLAAPDIGLAPTEARHQDQAQAIVSLTLQIAELKGMVGQMVASWGHQNQSTLASAAVSHRLAMLQGSWFNEGSGSYVYIRAIGDEIAAPYCYGANSELTAHYYDWREVGDYLFARFKWFDGRTSGFTFLKSSGPDTLQGGWWFDEDVEEPLDAPPADAANTVVWRRVSVSPPKWALDFFAQVQSGEIRPGR